MRTKKHENLGAQLQLDAKEIIFIHKMCQMTKIINSQFVKEKKVRSMKSEKKGTNGSFVAIVTVKISIRQSLWSDDWDESYSTVWNKVGPQTLNTFTHEVK